MQLLRDKLFLFCPTLVGQWNKKWVRVFCCCIFIVCYLCINYDCDHGCTQLTILSLFSSFTR